jgi:hypothetical protein
VCTLGSLQLPGAKNQRPHPAQSKCQQQSTEEEQSELRFRKIAKSPPVSFLNQTSHQNGQTVAFHLITEWLDFPSQAKFEAGHNKHWGGVAEGWPCCEIRSIEIG